MLGSMCESIDEHERLLVAQNITTDGFAKGFKIAIDVQIIVLQLECQTHFLTIGIESLGIRFGCATQQSTYLKCTGKQDRGLQTDHLEILTFCNVGTLFELHVILLSLVDLQGRLGEDADDGRQCR